MLVRALLDILNTIDNATGYICVSHFLGHRVKKGCVGLDIFLQGILQRVDFLMGFKVERAMCWIIKSRQQPSEVTNSINLMSETTPSITSRVLMDVMQSLTCACD
jgi:hypothetical protein